MATEKDREKDFEEAFNNAYDQWFTWIAEAHKDIKYCIDSPWDEGDKAYFREQNREILSFPVIRRIVKMVTGYERRNRLSLKIGPSEGSDDAVARQLTGIVMPIMENARGYEVMSDAFEMGSCMTGLNLIEPYFDRKGNIQFHRRPYNSFLLDPHFSRRDFGDCAYIICHEEGMLTDDVVSIVPGRESEIRAAAKWEPAAASTGTLPFSAYKGRGREDGTRCNYSAFWQKTTKKVKVVAHRQSGRTMVWRGEKKALEEMMARFYLDLTSWDDYIETVELTSLVNGREVHHGGDPNKIDDYPFVGVFGFWYPEYDDMGKKLQGIVRPCRDPQREIDKRLSKILDIIDSQVASGLMAEEGSLVDEEDIHASGQGKGIWTKKDALAQNRVERITPPDIPAGLFQLNQDLQRLISDIAGVNDSMFGTEELKQQMSGYLMKLRQGAGLTALQDLFDNLRFSKKLLGFKLIKMVQRNYGDVKIFRILNEPPVPQLRTEDLDTYDITPQEGLLTETQRQMFYVELLRLKEMGAPITWGLIFEYAPVQMKSKLIEMVKAEEQRMQSMQAAELQDKQLANKLAMAKIQADLGRAAEREANVQEHHADAALARIKTAKEIQNMDHDKTMDLLDRVIELEKLATMTKR